MIKANKVLATAFLAVAAACDAFSGNLPSHRRAEYAMLRLRPGAAVLDVGCGAGEVCVELAALVSPSGRVRESKRVREPLCR